MDNPLKGWATYADAGPIRQPYSMVYFYVPWKELEPQPGHYEFAAWEKKVWNTPAARGKHVVFRVYLDYPGQPTGVPSWLLAQGLKTHRYTDYGGGNSPDYDDPRLVAGLQRLIAALGKRYNENPRVAFIALGLLGYWGEWHTYPHVDWFASPATQAKIVDAYHIAFPHKILMGRYPTGVLGDQPWIGYHDDMIPSDTDSSQNWMFLPQMRHSGRMDNWKVAATGGEMAPREAREWLGEGYPTLLAAVNKAHFSWIGPYSPAIDPDQSPRFVARSADLVRRMGYQFRLTQLSCPEEASRGSRLKIRLEGENQGVAPFYYPWAVRIALLNSRHQVVQSVPIDVDIRKWLPGRFSLSTEPAITAQSGVYELAAGIIDPYTGKPSIRFANILPCYGGWTVLSRVRVVGRSASQSGMRARRKN
ncbi:MAG TPA: DUF4832 domain-containing protein [Capsulimonadaceae bacterium]|nr:DUF4832 domain-containing protein [Capsulimonadaceae bacterium]